MGGSSFTSRAAGKFVTWHNDDMHRAVLAFALVACGARTDLGGARGDASVVSDASHDVASSDAQVDAPKANCPPLVYVNDEQTSTSLAIDDAAVYSVLDPCQLWRTTKDLATTSTFSMGDCAGDIVVDDLHVYWTSAAGHLMRNLKDGPANTDDLGCAALNGCPGNVHVRAVGPDLVVLVDGFRPVAMSKKVSSAPYPLIQNGSPPAPVHYVFVDDARAYWNNDIRVFSNSMGDPTSLVQYATSSSGLAIDSTHVFWTASDNGAFDLFRADKDDTNEMVLSKSDTSTPLVASDSFVYGVSPSGITKQPTSGGAPSVVVPSVHPLTLALDADCIYFGEKTATGRRIARAAN
jgi:hypothetical protein